MLLLLFNGSVQGALMWSGPSPSRTALIEPETRTIVIGPS